MVHQIKQQDSKISAIDGSHAYRQLREKVVAAGILDRAYGYYGLLTSAVLIGFFGSLAALSVVTSYWAIIIWSLSFAFFAVHMGGIMHDAGHRAIFKSTKLNDIVGNIAGALLANSYNFWKKKHNLHHAHTNQVGDDPDVELPLLTFTRESYEKRTGLMRWLVRYQMYLYFPFGTLVVFSPRAGSIGHLRRESKKSVWWEIPVFFGMCFVWFVLPFWAFPFYKALIFFIVVSVSMGFYFLHVFAPNHKGMPEVAKGVKLSFLEQQVITSRNINGHWLTDFLYMGLNYQIEHHLFPNCPRINLPRVTPYVKEVCKKLGLEYTSVSIIETDKIILKELQDVSRQLTA